MDCKKSLLIFFFPLILFPPSFFSKESCPILGDCQRNLCSFFGGQWLANASFLGMRGSDWPKFIQLVFVTTSPKLPLKIIHHDFQIVISTSAGQSLAECSTGKERRQASLKHTRTQLCLCKAHQAGRKKTIFFKKNTHRF